MIPVTLERKRMDDEWEEAISPLFSQYVSKFEAEYDKDYVIKAGTSSAISIDRFSKLFIIP